MSEKASRVRNQAPNLVWLPDPVDDSVKDVGQGRGGEAQHPRGVALRHDLTVSEQEVFETVGHPGARLRPGGIFEASAMRRPCVGQRISRWQ